MFIQLNSIDKNWVMITLLYGLRNNLEWGGVMATPDMNYLHCFQDCTPANDEENFYLRKATNGRMPYKGRF